MSRNLVDIFLPVNEQRGFAPGDEAAHRAAAAMADRFDAPTIIALTDAISYLNLVGGQLHIVTLRRKVDIAGRPVTEGEDGEFRTEAFRLDYETRDARLVEARPPEEILGVPITDFGQPPTRIEVAPEVETDLRDEIEAEADATAALEPEPALTE